MVVIEGVEACIPQVRKEIPFRTSLNVQNDCSNGLVACSLMSVVLR